MTGKPLVKRRMGGPRSRNGCLVCRQRHLKCSEEKPTCKQCTAAGWPCHYRAGTGTESRTTPSEIMIVSHKPERIQTNPRTALLLDPSVTPAERSALHYYTDVAADRLFCYLVSDLWTYMIPQQCYNSAVVRSAVVALSSMHRDFDISSKCGHWPGGSVSSMQLYGRATRKLRLHILESGSTLSEMEVLLVCLTFVCFDMLRNKQDDAMRHLKNGVAVLSSCRVASQRRRLLGRDDDLGTISHAFMALNLHATTMLDTRKSNLGTLRHANVNALVIPAKYFDIKSAQVHLVQLNGIAFEHILDTASCSESIQQHNGEHISTARCRIQSNLTQWLQALSLFETDHHIWTGPRDAKAQKLAAIIAAMRAQHKSMQIMLDESSTSPDRFTFDEHGPQVLDWAELASELQAPRLGKVPTAFSVDTGLSPAVTLVAFKAGADHVRSRAVMLLERVRRVEGLYDPSWVLESVSILSAVSQRRTSSSLVDADRSLQIDSATSLCET